MVRLQNWKGDIQYEAARVEVVKTPGEIARIITDTSTYPSPVRVKGSHHSTTKCVVAEQGTVIDITQMNRILEIDVTKKTIRAQAGVLHIDAAKELEKVGLQPYVLVEIGNLTMGSAAISATKDASFVTNGKLEYGQVSSYCVGMKLVNSEGHILEYNDEEHPEMMEMLRGSYGLLGIVFEVTFKVKELKSMAVQHVKYSLDEFTENLDELISGGRSMMLYIFPYREEVTVEYRYDGNPDVKPTSWQWRLRNWVWKTGSPAFGKIVSALVPFKRLRSRIFDAYNGITQKVQQRILRGKNTSPADQIIRYSETAGFASYTFSIWGFPRERYAEVMRAYFKFCQDYFKDNGYRTDLLNVGYYIKQDRRSIFSYTRDASTLTLDPVSTGGEGWQGFLIAYNEFCSQHGGKPLLNQTPLVTPLQVKEAFKNEIPRFLEVRRNVDRNDRFYNDFFRGLFE